MNVSCAICDRQVDTRKEDINVTVSWVFEDLLKKNNVKYDKKAPRVVKICNDCWNNKLKSKPEGKDFYWSFNKGI